MNGADLDKVNNHYRQQVAELSRTLDGIQEAMNRYSIRMTHLQMKAEDSKIRYRERVSGVKNKPASRG